MKIIHLTFSLMNGGKENLLVDLANAQAERGNRVCIAILNDRTDKTLLGRIHQDVQVLQFKRKRASLFWFFRFFLFSVMQSKSAIFHCHDEALIRLLRFSRAKNLLTLHGLEFSPSGLEKYKRVIAISGTVYQALVKAGSKNCTTIHNAIDMKSVRQLSGYTKPEHFRLVQVGNLLHEYKGQDLSVIAAQILCREMNSGNFSLTLIGEGHSRAMLEKLVDDLNLSDRVKLPGSAERAQVRQHLCDYHIMLQPGRMEGFGLTVVEGLAAGLPVIASDIEGPAEILENGKFGYLFDAGDARALAMQIKRVMDEYGGAAFVSQRGDARQHATARYGLEQMTDAYLTAYKEI